MDGILARIIRTAITLNGKSQGIGGPYCNHCQDYGHTTLACPFIVG